MLGIQIQEKHSIKGRVIEAWTTYLAHRKSMTKLHVEMDLVKLSRILNFGYREKYVSSDLNWSFLSRFKEEIVRPNNIWFGVVRSSVNRVAPD